MQFPLTALEEELRQDQGALYLQAQLKKLEAFHTAFLEKEQDPEARRRWLEASRAATHCMLRLWRSHHPQAPCLEEERAFSSKEQAAESVAPPPPFSPVWA